MNIATWNVNSIRMRLNHLLVWLDQNPMDVVCLQETKVVDEQFPRSELEDRGYHCYCFGQKSYNGVAILSREKLDQVSYGFEGILGSQIDTAWDQQKRVIAAVYKEITIVNLYVPNGSSMDSEKYIYKLEWLSILSQYLTHLLAQSDRLHLCGDFNIAPDDRDIYDSADKQDHIMASIPERQALRSLLSLGLTDAFRHFYPDPGHFTWWDYRGGSFRRNLGWRIDHHYVSEALIPSVLSCEIDRLPRTWDKPSDHTPVVLTLANLE